MKNAILIGLFAASLTLPTVCFPVLRNRIDTANYENRALAEKPDLLSGELSLEKLEIFPAQFEQYYNDHVPFKNQFVRVKTKLDTELLGASSVGAVTVGQEHWLYYTVSEEGEDALADYQHTNLYPSEKLENLADEIRRVTAGMEENGKRFVLFVLPNKETIYGRYMPETIRVFREESRREQAVSYLQAQGLPVYDATETIREQADFCQLYYHCDSHWNRAGAFLGSQAIARVLTGDGWSLDDVEVTYTDISWLGDLARMLGRALDSSEDTECWVDGYLPEITEEVEMANEDNSVTVYTSNSENSRTLLVIGDSFSQYLKCFLPKLYARSVFTTFDSYTPEVFEQYEIDDVLYAVVERNQRYFEHPANVLAGRGWDGERLEEDAGN